AERHDERRKTEIGNQHAVERTDGKRGGDRRGNADLHAEPACMVSASTIEQRQRTEPTERSMPPVMITSVMPRAMMAVRVKLRVMLKMFFCVANESVAKLRKMQARTIATQTQKAWLRSSRDHQLCWRWAMVWSRVMAMPKPVRLRR